MSLYIIEHYQQFIGIKLLMIIYLIGIFMDVRLIFYVVRGYEIKK